MFRGFGIAVIALGLAASPLQIQAQPNEESASRNAGQQQEVSETGATGVVGVENEPTAQTTQSPQERAEQREIDDLAAQQGMNEATQRMAEIAEYQTWLIFAGTVLLLLTLWLTRQANMAATKASEAARDGVNVATATLAHQDEMMQRQIRAYLIPTECGIEELADGTGAILSCYISNSGLTPAFGAVLVGESFYAKYPLQEDRPAPEAEDQRHGANVAAGGQIICSKEISGPGFGAVQSQIESGEYAMWIQGSVSYKDVFGKPHRTKFRYVFARSSQRKGMGLVADEDGNEAD